MGTRMLQVTPNALLWIAVGALVVVNAQIGMLAREAQGPSRSVRDGVYSSAQVTRGESVYAEECARCHSQNLSGGESSPALTGESFIQTYQGLTLNDLFDRIRVSMPQESPGRLSRQQYVDVLAFILAKNGFATGPKELAHDASELRAIRIDPRSVLTPRDQGSTR